MAEEARERQDLIIEAMWDGVHADDVDKDLLNLMRSIGLTDVLEVRPKVRRTLSKFFSELTGDEEEFFTFVDYWVNGVQVGQKYQKSILRKSGG